MINQPKTQLITGRGNVSSDGYLVCIISLKNDKFPVIKVIKAVYSMTNLNLYETKKLIKSLPIVIGITLEENVKTQFFCQHAIKIACDFEAFVLRGPE